MLPFTKDSVFRSSNRWHVAPRLLRSAEPAFPKFVEMPPFSLNLKVRLWSRQYESSSRSRKNGRKEGFHGLKGSAGKRLPIAHENSTRRCIEPTGVVDTSPDFSPEE